MFIAQCSFIVFSFCFNTIALKIYTRNIMGALFSLDPTMHFPLYAAAFRPTRLYGFAESHWRDAQVP